MDTKEKIAKNWFFRYTGTQVDDLGDYVLLTNFKSYVDKFAKRFNCQIKGLEHGMQTSTNNKGLSIINFGIGSPNAALIMDLLTASSVKGVLFLGKCGGLKSVSELGNFILPIAAIRGDGTSDDYLPKNVPALPSFKLHKFVSEKILSNKCEYRTGVIYTTNRRLWEWDQKFKNTLIESSAIGVDMETATIFSVGHSNEISRGALLLVLDIPMTPEGVKTEESDIINKDKYTDLHLEIGIESMSELELNGEQIRHFRY